MVVATTKVREETVFGYADYIDTNKTQTRGHNPCAISLKALVYIIGRAAL